MAALKKIADDFSKAAAQYDAHASLQRHVLKQCWVYAQEHATSQILDVGAGTGYLAQMLGADYHVTQLDIAPGMCELAEAHGQTICADMHAIPLDDASVDMVFSSLALQWSDDPAKAVGEMLRVLKPGGVLAIASLAEGTLQRLAGIMPGRVRMFHHVPMPQHMEVLTHELQPIEESYPTLQTLLQQLKGLGAQNKSSSRAKPLTAAERPLLKQPHVDYWQVEYLVGRKQ